jgi:hypothetical protein
MNVCLVGADACGKEDHAYGLQGFRCCRSASALSPTLHSVAWVTSWRNERTVVRLILRRRSHER